MNFIIWIIVGGIIGWLASIVMKTDAHMRNRNDNDIKSQTGKKCH